MANIITESSKPMDNTLKAQTEISFKLLDEEDPKVAAIASDPGNPTLAERLFVHVKYIVERDDGGADSNKFQEWIHLDDTVVTDFTAGDAAAARVLLKKIYDTGKANLGL